MHMNCSRCNAPLVEGARFCRNCGLPVPENAAANPFVAASDSGYGQPLQGNMPAYAPTQPVAPIAPSSPIPPVLSQPYGQPPGTFSQNVGSQPGQFAQQAGLPGSRVRKRRWPMRVAITLIVLLVLVVGGWFLVARPILHSYAQSQIDQVISSDINQILPVPPVVNTLTASQNLINNLIVLTSTAGPVQDEVVHVSPPVFASDGTYSGGVQLTFQVYGFPCSVSAIPQASNGNVIVTHLQVSGIIAWVMSADELTTDLNTHLQDVVTHLGRSISNVTINNQEIDITLV